MTAAFDSVSFARATSVLTAVPAANDDDVLDDVLEMEDVDGRAVPEPPRSGIKSVVPPRTSLVVPHDRERVFRALYDEHAAFVWRNLRRLGVSERDVEDKVQEVFVVAHRRWGDFADLGHGPRAWLFQIALRVASDARRHARRHPVDPDGGVAEERQSVEPSQTKELARKQAMQLLDRALASIEIDRRAVLVLHEIEQMTAPEIARVLEIPLNTVYSRLRVARALVEQELKRLVDSREGER